MGKGIRIRCKGLEFFSSCRNVGNFVGSSEEDKYSRVMRERFNIWEADCWSDSEPNRLWVDV